MTFFKPEDFDFLKDSYFGPHLIKVADIANAKLERDGKVVYSLRQSNWTDPKADNDQWKALLINIEPIEKCKHPKEKVKGYVNTEKTSWDMTTIYKCECGAKVKPTSFEAVE